MRIVFHTHMYYPDTDAAARRFIGIAECLAKMGHEIDVICGYPDKIGAEPRKKWLTSFSEHEVVNGVNVHRYFTVPFNKGGTVRRLLNHYSFKFSSALARLKGKIDVIVTTSPPLIPCKAAIRLAKRYKQSWYSISAIYGPTLR